MKHELSFPIVLSAIITLMSFGCSNTQLPAYIGPDPRPFVMPKQYVCCRTTDKITIDGKLDEPSWQNAPWTDLYVDIEGQMNPVKPKYPTRCQMLWDDEYFYVAAKLEEPHVWGTLTERNSVIFHDNDFEVFIDPDGDSHTYYEFEINVLNTVWNLFMDRPYKHGGKAKNLDMADQISAVFVEGTVNDPSDQDKYWSLEVAFPWKSFKQANCQCPPADGQQWRINFSRVQWGHKIVDGKYVRVPGKAERTDQWHEDNWVWSPQGVINMHRPETWGYVQFSTKPSGSSVPFVQDPTAETRYLLHKVLYAQEQYHLQHQRYATTMNDLGFTIPTLKLLRKRVNMHAAEDKWQCSGTVRPADGNPVKLHIRQDGKVWRSQS